MPTRQTLSLPKNLHLSYLEWHQGNKPLLLLHGLADHSLVWSSLGDFLAHDYHIVAPDLRGHGDSGKPSQGYSFADVIGDLEALINHLGWSKFHVLGHSWAGKLVPIWARENPQLFNSLILVDPFFIGKMPRILKVTFPLLYRLLSFLKVMGPFASYEEAIEVAKQLKEYQGWSNLQEQVFTSGIEQKADGTWGSKFTVDARNQIFEEVMLVSGLTENIDIPTLLVVPEQGLTHREWQLKPYKTYLGNLEIVSVPGNHWAFLGEEEAFNQVVKDFLISS